MDTIIPFDLSRIFWGDAAPLYFLEILFRIAVIWPWTLLLLRWIGGRSISQLSLAEFLLVIALGSAVGDSLFLPDVPLFHAMLTILVVVLIDKLMDLLIRHSQRSKQLIDGTPIEVVRDGQILGQGLAINKISTAEVMELLRLRGVENLGAIARAYIEPSGKISVFAAEKPRIGLPIVPPLELRGTDEGAMAHPVCASCGAASPGPSVCETCGCEEKVAGEQAKPWIG